jgi:transcriptional regulator with XRE-family HTH domain
MTQAELAALVGTLSQSHIARIEAGRYSVGFDHLQAISEALGGNVDIVV